MTDELTTAQRAALQFADETARRLGSSARDRLERVLREAACPVERLELAIERVRTHARVVLHFHPDRYGLRPMTVAEALLADGQYRNQFETGLSSGSRTAVSGGSRDRWERELFGGAYHRPDVRAPERPKYGALELVRYPDGPIPRFGSCYFVLDPSVSTRSTFTFGGSERARASERFGTIETLQPVFAGLLEEIAGGGHATVPWPPFAAPTLGIPDINVRDFLARLTRDLCAERPAPSLGSPGRVLDSCVEAHVHGAIDLRRDVERLVVDPAFEGTPTGSVLADVARAYEIELQWHRGFRMAVDQVPDDFRGPVMIALAHRIAIGGMIDAAAIGAAEATLHQRPQEWDGWEHYGSRDDTVQHLKQLWHVLVHYGAPARPPDT